MRTAETTVFAGELNRRIQLQELVGLQDETGGQSRTWATQLTVWASIQPTTGRELNNAAELYPEADTQFIIRYNSALPTDDLSLAAWRILDQYGNQYDIANVSDVSMRHIRMDIFAIQRPPGRNA